MYAVKTLIGIGMAFIMGCVPSLHPLYTSKDVVYDPALVTTWIEKEGKNTWTFQSSGDQAYKLIFHQREYGKPMGKPEPGEPAEFEVHLVQIGKYLFLDIYPEELAVKNDFYKIHLVPSHTFSRIWIEGDVIRLAMLNPDWFEDRIDEGKVDIAHEQLDGLIILTATTNDLQQFVLKYAEDTQVFTEPIELHREK